MVNEIYKEKAHHLVKKAKEKGLITKYKNFCKSDLAKETDMSEEEVNYYISQNKEETK